MEGPPEALFKARTARENHTPVGLKILPWGRASRGMGARPARGSTHTQRTVANCNSWRRASLSFLRRAQSIELAREHLGIDRAQVAGHLRGSEPVYVAHFDGAGDAERVGDD